MKTPTIRIHDGHRLDETELAEAVAAREGLKINMPIGQVSEVVRHTLDVLGDVWRQSPGAVVETVAHHARPQPERPAA